jgi:Ala-tRNA(Pro) deacylase
MVRGRECAYTVADSVSQFPRIFGDAARWPRAGWEGTVRPRALDELLQNAHVPFTTFQHAAAFSAQKEAALSHVPGRSWAKTVICFADEEAVAAVVPAHLSVDLEQVRLLAGAASVRLAREPELATIYPDCEVGAVSPFTSRWKLRIFVDRTFVGDPEMVFSAGTHTDAIRMHYGDFADLTRPVVGLIGAAGQPRRLPTASAMHAAASQMSGSNGPEMMPGSRSTMRQAGSSAV